MNTNLKLDCDMSIIRGLFTKLERHNSNLDAKSRKVIAKAWINLQAKENILHSIVTFNESKTAITTTYFPSDKFIDFVNAVLTNNFDGLSKKEGV